MTTVKTPTHKGVTTVTAIRTVTYRLDNCHAVSETSRMPTTGPQLRRLRRSSEVTVVAIAARMKLSRQSLWALERAAVVDSDKAEQYRAAVRDATLTSDAA